MDVKVVLAQFKLLSKREEVLIECSNINELVTESGIYLGTPSIIYDRPTEGIVIQKTEAVKDINIGDKIHFGLTKGIDLCYSKEKWYIILKVEDILGVEC